MVNYRPVAAGFAVLTVVFAAAAGYFATNPMTQPATSTLPGATVTNTVTQTTTVSTVRATSPFTVKLVWKAGVGFYMTNASGWTLYLRKGDNQTAGTSSCTGGCIAAWPAFYASNLTLPAGFDQNDFKLVPRADGIKQLAYYGWPLYYYVKDKAPGDTTGQGAGSVWFVCCSL
jgi:predicted lipoprotein with Yx(FWY)xxD motif